MFRNRSSLKALPFIPKRVLIVIIVVLLSLTLAVGSPSAVLACEGAPGSCMCPGCG